MGVQRLNLKQLEDAILQVMGYASSQVAPWETSQFLYQRINEYLQRLPMRLNSAAREAGLPVPVRLDMWKSSANSATTGATVPMVTAGSSTVYMPTDYDHYISIYDITNKRPIQVLEKADKWHWEKLVKATPGPPRYLDIGGFASDGGSPANWRRVATFYPATEGGVTPSIRLQYWRIPAAMTVTPAVTAESQYPDIDPKYESICIHGPVLELARIDLARQQNIGFENSIRVEREIIQEMLATCKSV